MRSILKCSSITALWAELVAEELVRLGVKLVCIAPGSRSTPLVAACARHEGLEKVVCQDERSAGFYALGYGRAAGIPAAVITTSGSAVANLFPSVVEASNDRVPLLLLTADRPPELRAVGANQTIDQAKIFGGYTRSFVDIPVPDDRISLRYVLSTVDQALASSSKGPVHLNFMFREPFEPDVDQPFDRSILKGIAAWAEHNNPLCRRVDLEAVMPLMRDSQSGIIVCGAICDQEAELAVVRLSEKIGWPILPDVLSNLRFHQSPAIANFFDFALLDAKLESHVPDVVLQIGGRIVSKRLQTFLDRGLSKAHIYIGDEPERFDPGCVVTHRVEGCARDLLCHASEGWHPEAARRRMDASLRWHDNSEIVCTELIRQEIDTSLSEITVARSLVRSLSSNHALFCSVSMPVRDVNMFAEPHADPPRLYANRGASGIDGIVSSACGVSKALEKRCVLLCGDLTFLYDTNGLGLINSLDMPFVIVVVNNQGAGIFTMLNIHKQTDIFTPYWDAEHDVQLSKLCAAYELKHVKIDTLAHWNDVLATLPNATEHMIVEVVSDKWENKKAHDHIREAVQRKFAS